MQGWIAGLIGGLAGTAALTMVMMPFMKGTPPGPSYLLGKILGKSPASLMMPGMMGHFMYGGIAGLVFGAVAVNVLGWQEALWAWGIVFGLILMAMAAMILGPVSGMSKAMNEKMGGMMKVAPVMMAAHVVYGAVLGVIVHVWAT